MVRTVLPRTIHNATEAPTRTIEIQISAGCGDVRADWEPQSPASTPSVPKATRIRTVYAAPNRRSPYAIVAVAMSFPPKKLPSRTAADNAPAMVDARIPAD